MENSTGSSLLVSNGTISFVDFKQDGTNIFTTNNNDCLLVQKLDGTDILRVSCTNGLIWTRKLIPITSLIYDNGDSTHLWRDIYLYGNLTNVTYSVPIGTILINAY